MSMTKASQIFYGNRAKMRNNAYSVRVMHSFKIIGFVHAVCADLGYERSQEGEIPVCDGRPDRPEYADIFPI